MNSHVSRFDRTFLRNPCQRLIQVRARLVAHDLRRLARVERALAPELR